MPPPDPPTPTGFQAALVTWSRGGVGLSAPFPLQLGLEPLGDVDCPGRMGEILRVDAHAELGATCSQGSRSERGKRRSLEVN